MFHLQSKQVHSSQGVQRRKHFIYQIDFYLQLCAIAWNSNVLLNLVVILTSRAGARLVFGTWQDILQNKGYFHSCVLTYWVALSNWLNWKCLFFSSLVNFLIFRNFYNFIPSRRVVCKYWFSTCLFLKNDRKIL